MKGNNGSAFAESLISIVLLITFLGANLTLWSMAYSRMWLDHLLYEALICLAESRPRLKCELKLRRTAQYSVPWAQIISLRLEGESRQLRGELKWKVAGREVAVRKSMARP